LRIIKRFFAFWDKNVLKMGKNNSPFSIFNSPFKKMCIFAKSKKTHQNFMRYFLKLSYNGSNYYGWQVQPKQISVQYVLEEALSLLLREKIHLTGAGRTDTGVHARIYYAHFDCQQILHGDFLYKMNAFLPKDIAILDILQVSDNAHARFDAVSRTYKYYIATKKNPFEYPFVYQILSPLKIDIMNDCCDKLLIYSDFTSFSKVNTQVKTNICRIELARWTKVAHLLIFEIRADRFLRNMVRAIVGTLLSVGKGKLSVDDFCRIIESKNRCNAGVSVPANALFLEDIQYPENYFNNLNL
jgi:tRNA pseudouridine38-40 synthase